MTPLNSQINLRLINNTALPQPVSILGIVPNQNTANNNNIIYEFNFTGQSFLGITNVNINIANTSNPTVVVYNAPVTSQTIIGVVDALNTLNQGLFSYSGSTIYVSSNYYIYSNISIAGTSILGITGSNPRQIALDSFGNVFTANSNSNDVTKITQSGVDSTLPTGGTDPQGITIDSAGYLYTCNNFSNDVSKISQSGSSIILGGTDLSPQAITIDSAGNIYTANQTAQNITKITPLGISTNYGTLGFGLIGGMVIDSVGNVFVVCSSNTVVKVDPSGISTTFGVFPSGNYTISIAIDSSDNIYVADNTDSKIYKLTPLAVQTVYGTTSNPPYGIAIDSSDNVYCTTFVTKTVEKILATGGTVLLANLTIYGGLPNAISVDNFFNVYVADILNNVVYLIVQ